MLLKKLCKKHHARKLDSSFAMHFLDVYETYFADIRERNLEVLEIGVQKGGSIKMWADYFPNSNITGVDVTKKCKKHETDRIKVRLGDQADAKFLSTLGKFDVIIDDGGHTMIQQKTSLIELWDHLNPGGLYVLEDLETSYWPAFGGGYKKEETTVEFLKCRIDNMNHEATKHSRAEKEKIEIENYNMESISFYKSLYVIKKEKK